MFKERLPHAIALNVGLAFVGDDFDPLPRAHILLENGTIVEVGEGWLQGGVDLRGYAAAPMLINSHVHLADSCLLEPSTYYASLKELVGSHGLKHRVLRNSSLRSLLAASRSMAQYMMLSGTCYFVEFRELGAVGCAMARAAYHGLACKALVLGRPHGVWNASDVLLVSDGLGYATAFNGSRADASLAKRLGKIVAAHVSETLRLRELGDLEYAVNELGADVLVHCTWIEGKDVELVAKAKLAVLCVRANMFFSAGLPPVGVLLENDVNVGLGTDNAAWIKPDMWRELEAAYNLLRLQNPKLADPRRILRAATINPASALGLDAPLIAPKRKAMIALIDLESTMLDRCRDPLLGLVKRCSGESISACIYGDVVVGSCEALRDRLRDLQH